MKRPGWLGGQGGPAPDEEPGDRDRERARRERLRAQRRLAEKAGSSTAEAKSASPEPDAKPESERADPKPSKPKPRPPSQPKRSPEKQKLPALTALRQGAEATRSRTKGVPTRLLGGALAGLGAVFAIFFDVLGFLLNLLIWVWLKVMGPGRALLARCGRLLRSASAAVTPLRVLVAVVAGAAVLLALSQFADYRSISVGTDAYAEVETVAPAPEKERDETGSAHSYLMVPLAISALMLLAAALSGRRWRLCRLIALTGVVAIGVSLLVDRPAGLDPGDLEQSFEGVRAQLLGGFYAQLFSGLLLTVAALMLGRELRTAGAPAHARSGPRRSRRGLLRRPSKPEGAHA